MLKTIDEVLATGLRVSSIDGDDSLPDMQEAARLYIIPLIGATLYNAVADAWAKQGTPQDATIPAAIRPLLPFVARPIAAYAYLHELPAMHSRITSSGVRRTTTDNMPTAFKWEYENVKDYLEERAASNMDALLLEIDARASDLQAYIDAAIAAERKKLLIKSGPQMAAFFPLCFPAYTYHRLLPVQRKIIDTYIIPVLTPDFYNNLVGATGTDVTTNPNSEQAKTLLQILGYAVTNLCIAESVDLLPVKMTPQGFTIVTPQANAGNQAPAPDDSLGRLRSKTFKDGKMYLRRAINALNVLASSSQFASFYNSSKYTGVRAARDLKNDQRKVYRF